MSTADTYVRARIDTRTKERAADALEAMGLSISDAIRLLMLRIADERRMPFDTTTAGSTTVASSTSCSDRRRLGRQRQRPEATVRSFIAARRPREVVCPCGPGPGRWPPARCPAPSGCSRGGGSA